MELLLNIRSCVVRCKHVSSMFLLITVCRGYFCFLFVFELVLCILYTCVCRQDSLVDQPHAEGTFLFKTNQLTFRIPKKHTDRVTWGVYQPHTLTSQFHVPETNSHSLVNPVSIPVCTVGVPILEKELADISIPDISGDASTPVGGISYTLSK